MRWVFLACPGRVTFMPLMRAGLPCVSEKRVNVLENSVSFGEADPMLARYLSGDVLPSDKRGWTLVQADGLSLGWAKGDGSQLKNHYPKALRRPV